MKKKRAKESKWYSKSTIKKGNQCNTINKQGKESGPNIRISSQVCSLMREIERLIKRNNVGIWIASDETL